MKHQLLLTSILALATCHVYAQSGNDITNHKQTSVQSNLPAERITVPMGGNTWRAGAEKRGGRVTNNGIDSWSDKNVSFNTYVRVTRSGSMKLWLQLSVPKGESILEVSIHGMGKQIKVAGKESKSYYAGEWQITDTGYVAIHLTGISKTGATFGDISNILLEGTSINAHTAYVKNNDGNFFYWGRRGPSVHLNYKVPENTHTEWFYNEVTVPEGNDIIGSYFMADGFGEGYFGMQVNSADTRHILFSVWSPFKTDNPEEIPDSMKIRLLKKGDNVHAGEFGNEGSGGQSYMNYPWKAGNTYKFLLHGVPNGPNHTIYTAYFYAPEEGKWQLIASFRRPQTHTYLKHLHSFLENFSPNQGDQTRRVLFGNQWICTNKGKWIPLNQARFTIDNTGRKGYRLDYGGGVANGKFYLQNCGFFNNFTPADTSFEHQLNGEKPQIDFSKLP